MPIGETAEGKVQIKGHYLENLLLRPITSMIIHFIEKADKNYHSLLPLWNSYPSYNRNLPQRMVSGDMELQI